MQNKIFVFYSPFLDQSLSIALLLKKYKNDDKVFGVDSIYNLYLKNRYIYDGLYSHELICSQNNDIVIVPTGAKDTQFFLSKKDISIGKITLKKNALQVYDKWFAIRAASSVGIPTPKSWIQIDDVNEYPIFYKQKYEEGGGIRGIALKKSEIPAGGTETLIYQEFIFSQGTYGVAFLADEGRLLTSYTHFERESLPKEGGSAVIIENFLDPRLLEYTTALIANLNYSGWGLAEYKFCPNRKDFVFMEINAKFWASCDFSFKNNPKFLKLLFDVDSRENKTKRIIYIDRALSRGFLFTIKNILKYPDSIFVIYPNFLKKLLHKIAKHFFTF